LPAVRQKDFTEAVIADIEAAGLRLRSGGEQRKIRTLFFGGGTPSVLAPKYLEAIVQMLESSFDFTGIEERSMEVNPSSIHPDKLSAWRGMGFHRFSLGVQSFDATELEAMGRAHDPAGAHAALSLLASTPGIQFSGDLIFGLPNQSPETFWSHLRTLLEYQPGHVSFYGLTIEAGTEFDKRHRSGKIALPPPDRYNQASAGGVEVLAQAGYSRYEVSNFSRPGFECKHNQGYWDGVEYAGFGPGAHSFHGRRRTSAPGTFEGYLDWVRTGFLESGLEIDLLDDESLLAEAVSLALRQSKGLASIGWEQRWGRRWPLSRSKKWVDTGMAQLEDSGQFRLQGEGWALLDEIAADLLAGMRPVKAKSTVIP
jgi:oxygen-independent coproporphyrinogen-3 oxidase